jgi:hypothetical protein
MPNLLPDWHLTLPFDLGLFGMREAGRLIWSLLLLVIGIVFVVTLIKPPALKRPFPARAGYALFGVIIVGTLLLGKLIPDFQRTIVWLGLGAVVAHALLMVASREPRDPERTTTWAEAFGGAVAVFALFALGYGIFPHEWLEFANAQLEWGDNTKFIFESNEAILGIGGLPNYPFSMDFPALRDIVVSAIYGIVLVTNLKLWVMWQKRLEVAPEAPAGEATPERRSRFGRPLQRWSARRAEAGVPSSTAPEGA